MTRMWRVLLAMILACGWVSMSAPAAWADSDSDDEIDDYRVNVTLDETGTALVELTLALDFGRTAGHGPFITLPVRQAMEHRPDEWLNLDVELLDISSPSGANTNTDVSTNSDGTIIKVGRKGVKFTGIQTYVLTYRLKGVAVAKHPQSGLDEFSWNAVGPKWQIPIRRASVRVEGPAAVTKAACFWGPGYDRPCTATTDEASAAYEVGRLAPETPMQVVAGYPAGTFVGTTQTFSKRYRIGNMFPLTPATGAVTLGLSVAGAYLVRSRVKRHLRDEAYLGFTPGMTPLAGQQAVVGEAKDAPVAVQFQPPRGARPGELGTLLDASADTVDVTATIVDLAVRGYLVITPKRDDQHVFQRTDRPWNDLPDYERHVLSTMFRSRPVVTTKDLADADYAGLSTKTKSKLYKRVVELRWFRSNPEMVRLGVVGLAIGCILLGGLVGFGAALVGWGLIGIAGIVTGIVLIASMRKFSARTAEGSAVLAQTKGFELYLSTAEANQIKFEEGIDVFSRYLPYAIVFGVAERWAKVFSDLERQGIYRADTRWYGGAPVYAFYGSGFGSGLSGLTSSMSSAMSSSISAATASSSGSSGFSGGGGFGGGGGGSW